MHIKEICDNIRNWAQERGLYDKGDPTTQAIKLGEEFGELCDAILKKDEAKFADSVGDMFVVLVNICELYSKENQCEPIDMEYCIAMAWDQIKDRTGKMENGTFVKDGTGI